VPIALTQFLILDSSRYGHEEATWGVLIVGGVTMDIDRDDDTDARRIRYCLMTMLATECYGGSTFR
jgi:hypothetical protein